jgi:hypothetical protein
MTGEYFDRGLNSGPQSLIQKGSPLALCALTGFLSAFTVSIVGLLPIGELVLLLILPWVLVKCYISRGWPTRIQSLGWYKVLMVLVGIMAVGYVASDIYRATPGGNLARGWARVSFLAVDLVCISYLIDGSWTRLRTFLFALYVGNCVNGLLTHPDPGLLWEFGVGPVFSAFVLFLVAGRAVGIQVVTALLLGGVALLLGARSLGGICLLTGVLFGLRSARGVFRPIALLAVAGAMVAFVFAADQVLLRNQDKQTSNVERQSMIETAADAFISSPLIGQGSWFTATKMIADLEEHREKIDPHFHGYTDEETRQISIHSQLLVSLAEAGILGGLFFIAFGALLIKTLRLLTRNSVPRRAFTLYVAIDALWNVLMSPFSGAARVAIGLGVCCCLLVIMQRQGELTDDYRE